MTRVRHRALSKALLAVYLLAAAWLPFSHHDVICHLKSSTHCTSCLVSSSGEEASGVAAIERATLVDAGHAAIPSTAGNHLVSIAPLSGRAPPPVG